MRPSKEKNINIKDIYYMKKARIYYLFAFLLAIVFIMTLYHRITIVFFTAVIIIPILSFLLMLLGYYFVKFEVFVERRVFEKKETAHTLIRISNEGFLPAPFIKIRIMQIDENGKSVDENIYAFSLYPFKGLDFNNNIVMKRRGLYEVGIKDIEFYDLLGLFRLKRDINEIIEILVLPKRILLYGNMMRNIFADDGDEKNKSKIGEDRTIVSHIRDYSDGDNINSIHWKLSSKRDELIVKVYDRPNDNNIMIIADMQSSIFHDSDMWEDSGDAVVESALTLALKCVYEGKRCTLYWYDTMEGNIVWYEVSTFSEFDTAFDHLAVTRVSFDNINVDDILKNNEICDTHNKVIYTVTQSMNLKTADILSSLAQYDDCEINCICVDLQNLTETSDYLDELALNNVNVVKISSDNKSDIETILNDFIA